MYVFSTPMHTVFNRLSPFKKSDQQQILCARLNWYGIFFAPTLENGGHWRKGAAWNEHCTQNVFEKNTRKNSSLLLKDSTLCSKQNQVRTPRMNIKLENNFAVELLDPCYLHVFIRRYIVSNPCVASSS